MSFHRKGILITCLILIFSAINPVASIKANEKSFPSQFDWRNEGYDFPVKDQGDCDAGYAFAGVEAVQAAIWRSEGVKVDLSENHAIRCNWHALNDYNNHACNGGDFTKIVNLFTQEGLVLDSCDPFTIENPVCNRDCETVYYVTEWQHVTPNTEIAGTDEIKQLLVQYGPVYSEMDNRIPGFEDYEGGEVLYYQDVSFDDNSHSVLIIGWDDEIFHSHGQGAWIIKNSYGVNWGDDGYFYLAYESAGIGNGLGVITGYHKSSPINKVYFYDEAGYNTRWGFNQSDLKRGNALANFTVETKEYTRAVEFWTADKATVNLYLYSNFDENVPKEKISDYLNYHVPNAGYFNIELPFFEMEPGDEIVVELEITNQNKFSPLTTEFSFEPSQNKTWYLDDDDIWKSFYLDHKVDAAIRLRTGIITEDFSKIFLPFILN